MYDNDKGCQDLCQDKPQTFPLQLWCRESFVGHIYPSLTGDEETDEDGGEDDAARDPRDDDDHGRGRRGQVERGFAPGNRLRICHA